MPRISKEAAEKRAEAKAHAAVCLKEAEHFLRDAAQIYADAGLRTPYFRAYRLAARLEKWQQK